MVSFLGIVLILLFIFYIKNVLIGHWLGKDQGRWKFLGKDYDYSEYLNQLNVENSS